MEASGVTRFAPSARIDRGEAIQLAVIAALLAFALIGLPQLLSGYWIDTSTTAVIYAVAALGVGLLVGRVGMISLGQVAVLALGAWVGAKFCFATTLPYPIVLLLSGLITMVLGVLIGIPALRVSGLYLALVTLMLAGAINVVLTNTNFPNGGTGFLGYNENYPGTIRRPSIATSDAAFFRYSIVIAVVMFALVLWHLRAKPGRAWAAIRQSETAALTAGVNVTVYKMWALAVASFITGVAGALLASSSGKLYNYSFPTQQSVILFAVVLMGGIYTLWGAVLAGVLLWVLPALFTIWGIDSQVPTILFGIGVLQVLTTAPAGIAHQFPRDMAKLGKLIYRQVRKLAPTPSRAS
jgi:branched-chain amino acid transport system permease protein